MKKPTRRSAALFARQLYKIGRDEATAKGCQTFRPWNEAADFTKAAMIGIAAHLLANFEPKKK